MYTHTDTFARTHMCTYTRTRMYTQTYPHHTCMQTIVHLIHTIHRPESFSVIVDDASSSVLQGIKAGLRYMEVDFPPVPTQLDGG